MKSSFFLLLSMLILISLGCLGCSREGLATGAMPPTEDAPPVAPANASPGFKPSISLGEIAELERAGGYFPGLGLAESGLHESAGDYGAAVIASYKELSWAYGYGSVDKPSVEDGIRQVLEYLESQSLNAGTDEGKARSNAVNAAKGVLAFSGEDWKDAASLLNAAGFDGDESDSFARWMLLVCSLETGDEAARLLYGAIRARYSNFPEYWYRGARGFKGNIASSYAEQCINLNPQGHFAPECRKIIAGNLGLGGKGEAIRSKAEIEDGIKRSVSAEDPRLLEDILPLMSLPDNVYTLYALGSLKALAAYPVFKEYFSEQASLSGGRLAERLSYISRG
ncbi:hypothetical protein [Leadbettera azotonutricia]|uniref:Putative lipoprotein n=1 Tax=Leadbettera azotonutricia (strain ATCC BAA-888 / DSM 13862 / ZAS-9) TaxID=545695 RepID=F5Y6M7_LEAAZ|nr:hypothetical protein [Leadbettera azotonutricia]AEF80855.1 putative lipoprotein [Leadbettera azotonutricia ZAS-9]